MVLSDRIGPLLSYFLTFHFCYATHSSASQYYSYPPIETIYFRANPNSPGYFALHLIGMLIFSDFICVHVLNSIVDPKNFSEIDTYGVGFGDVIAEEKLLLADSSILCLWIALLAILPILFLHRLWIQPQHRL